MNSEVRGSFLRTKYGDGSGGSSRQATRSEFVQLARTLRERGAGLAVKKSPQLTPLAASQREPQLRIRRRPDPASTERGSTIKKELAAHAKHALGKRGG